MARWLMLDIGAGTLDLLVVDSEDGQSYKAVAKSPIRTVAEEIEATPGPLAVTGGEMGGAKIGHGGGAGDVGDARPATVPGRWPHSAGRGPGTSHTRQARPARPQRPRWRPA